MKIKNSQIQQKLIIQTYNLQKGKTRTKLMKKISTFVFVSLLLIMSLGKQRFSPYIDPWNCLSVIEGKFESNHTVYKQAKCNPCEYQIIVYRDYVELLIDNPKENNTKNVLAFEFNVEKKNFDQTILDFDRYKVSLESQKKFNQFVERVSRQGIEWVYQLTLPIEGLILKGHNPSHFPALIPIITIIYAICVFLSFPLTANSRREQKIQIPRRTPLISLIIMSQLQHIIFIEIVCIAIKYLIYEESFLTKSLWYGVFMIPFGFTILQILYLYDATRIRSVDVFKEVKVVRVRDLSIVMVFLVGIYVLTGVILLVKKSIWIYAYFGVYLLQQIIISIKRRTYPYLRLSLYYMILMSYQLFLSSYEPLFWFQQVTRKDVLIISGVMFGTFVLGSLMQKFLIGIQSVNQVLFEESKNIEMGDQGSAKSTEFNLEG